jgi:hypothetical protein
MRTISACVVRSKHVRPMVRCQAREKRYSINQMSGITQDVESFHVLQLARYNRYSAHRATSTIPLKHSRRHCMIGLSLRSQEAAGRKPTQGLLLRLEPEALPVTAVKCLCKSASNDAARSRRDSRSNVGNVWGWRLDRRVLPRSAMMTSRLKALRRLLCLTS